MIRDRRGVSNMVGFILIFAIILTGATLAMTIGQGTITDISADEQTRNADRAMTLLGQDINHLGFTRAASSESAINLNDAQFRYENDSEVVITVENESAAGTPFQRNVSTGSLVYDMGETVLRYENGLVIRSDSGNAVALTDMELSCNDDRAIVSIVTLRGNEDRQVGGGRVTIDTFLNETAVVYPQNRTGVNSSTYATNVSLDVTSNHEEVWEDRMEASEWTLDDGEFECGVKDGRVLVRQAVVDVEVQR